MTTQAQTHAPLGFIEGEIGRQEQRLARLEEQQASLLEQRQEAVTAASLAADATIAEERRRAGIAADSPQSPFRRGGLFIEPMQGMAEVHARQRGGPWLAAAMASDAAFKLTQQLNALGALLGQARQELEQLRREEGAALNAAGQHPRGWTSPTERLLSKPSATAGGIG